MKALLTVISILMLFLITIPKVEAYDRKLEICHEMMMQELKGYSAYASSAEAETQLMGVLANNLNGMGCNIDYNDYVDLFNIMIRIYN